jgi:hypothetical protein
VLDFTASLVGKPPPVAVVEISAEMQQAKRTALFALVGGGVFLLLGGVQVAHKLLFRKPDVVTLIRERSSRIVWAYKKVATAKMNGVRLATFEFVVFALHPKKERIEVRLTPAVTASLLAKLPLLVPQATLGYSTENEQRFAKDPASMRCC